MKKCIFTCLALVIFAKAWSQTPAVLPLKIGEKAPLIEGTDNNGKKLKLKSLLKEHNAVVIFFYRGQWDPYCIKEVKAYQDSIAMFKTKNAFVIAVTPENDLGVSTTVSKTGASFSIIHDTQYKIMKLFGVNITVDDATLALMHKYRIDIDANNGNRDHILPVPATFVIAKNGKITFIHFEQSYKNRASVQEVLNAIL